MFLKKLKVSKSSFKLFIERGDKPSCFYTNLIVFIHLSKPKYIICHLS